MAPSLTGVGVVLLALVQSLDLTRHWHDKRLAVTEATNTIVVEQVTSRVESVVERVALEVSDAAEDKVSFGHLLTSLAPWVLWIVHQFRGWCTRRFRGPPPAPPTFARGGPAFFEDPYQPVLTLPESHEPKDAARARARAIRE